MAKFLTAIIAANLSDIAEQHLLLPKNHFRGRPGCSTVNTIHYLTNKVHQAWQNNKVASILFLDVEGAFPNAVTTRLIHNLKKRRIPATIINFVKLLLYNRKTQLKFDDYISQPIPIQNRIGQGDPLSMLLYIFYNADILNTPANHDLEDAIGYINYVAIIAIGENLEETTGQLRNLMTRDKGGLEWSRIHNSKFKVNKSAVMHFSRKSIPDPDNNSCIPLPRPELILEGQLVKETKSYKYLGILIDNCLTWKEQAHRTTANTTKWILQFRRLTKPSTGIKSRLMQQLYKSVALPKITYGIVTWYTPPNKHNGQSKNSSSVAALHNLKKIQRITALAITGTLRTSPNDFLDVHANILPMELALLKSSHSATICHISLPDTNPVHQIIKNYETDPPNIHLSPLYKLIKLFQLSNICIETIKPAVE